MFEHLILDFFASNNIAYRLFKHQPVFTVAEKPVLIDSGDIKELPGLHLKTLFLKDKKDNSFWLVSVAEDKRVDLKQLSNVLERGRFSFGKPEELMEQLRLEPGSVTPFGLIFDQENKITFVLDEDALSASFVNFHPLRNDMTVCLEPQVFVTSMEKMGHRPLVIRGPVAAE